jgi:SAM-dependent methyltransferase
MRVKKDWCENESLWRATYPFMFPESRIARAGVTVDKTIELTGVRGKSALDLCCGPGRCSVALAGRGFSVTGVDRSRFLLAKARARARAEKQKIEWIHEDMRNFVRPDAYDLALSMFTSFGYFETRGEDSAVLAKVFRSLRRGGAFLMDLYGKELLAKRFLESSVDELPDGSMLVEKRKIAADWNRVENEWLVLRSGRSQRFAFHINLYSGQELRDAFEEAGFVDVKLFGNLDGAPYDMNANRLIVVGRKSK